MQIFLIQKNLDNNVNAPDFFNTMGARILFFVSNCFREWKMLEAGLLVKPVSADINYVDDLLLIMCIEKSDF